MIDPANNIPNGSSLGAQWIEWHKAMLKYGYSRNQANQTFLQAWQSTGAQSSWNANNNELRNYMATQGLTISSNIWGGGLYDEAVNSYNSFGGAFSSIGNFAAIAVILVVIFAGYMVYRFMQD